MHEAKKSNYYIASDTRCKTNKQTKNLSGVSLSPTVLFPLCLLLFAKENFAVFSLSRDFSFQQINILQIMLIEIGFWPSKTSLMLPKKWVRLFKETLGDGTES